MTLKEFLNSGAFNQKSPCSDCPFRKKGGVRHGLFMTASYIMYFLSNPGNTFPCHKSVPRELPRDRWTKWQLGQTLCAGGLIFAKKQGKQNAVVEAGIKEGVYDPEQHTDTDCVFDTPKEMFDAQEEK